MNGFSLKVSKAYEGKTIFEDFRLDITEGEILCVLGASGAGKTTLLNILAGLTEYEGEITGKNQSVGYIFQEPRLLANLSVEKNLLYAGASVEKIADTLKKIGLYEHKNKKPVQLSGGEKQRVNFARAFLSGAELLLCDEPFSSLDIPLKEQLYRSFATLWQERKPTVVLVTHDIEEAWALGHRIVLLKEGKIVFEIMPNRKEFPAPYGKFDEGKEKLLKKIRGR